MVAIWILSALTTAYLLYRYVTSTFNYFSDQGIDGPKPIPVIGNLWGIWKENMPERDVELVRKYGKVLAYFEGRRPTLWVTDARLIRSIFVKEFDTFVDRKKFVPSSRGVRKWLSGLRGKEWKEVRSAVTPAFTSGKIKRMSLLIRECVDLLADKFATLAQNEGKMDAKILFSAFTMDVIARCAFGLKIDSLGNKDDPFVEHSQYVLHADATKTPAIMLPNMYPEVFNGFLLDWFLVTKHMRFFLDLLDQVIRERSESEEKFNDFIEIATEAIVGSIKKGTGEPLWTMEEIEELVMAQSSLFMIAGFDTTATALTNACYLLAKHQDVQTKLYQAIKARREECGEVGHVMVTDIPYLDQFINEVLRIYPPAVRIDREANRDITLTHNGKPLRLKRGMAVTVPIYALHHLEDYYPDPEKFDPDRWGPENKAKNPYAFMPFGMGPRNCVGMRFALEEMKIALATLVHQFRFFPVQETPEKLEFEKGWQLVLQSTRAVVGIELRHQP